MGISGPRAQFLLEQYLLNVFFQISLKKIGFFLKNAIYNYANIGISRFEKKNIGNLSDLFPLLLYYVKVPKSVKSQLVIIRATQALAILALELIKLSQGLTRSDIRVEPKRLSKDSTHP